MEDFMDYLQDTNEGPWNREDWVSVNDEREAIRGAYLKGLIHALSFCEKVAPPGSTVKEGFVLKALPYIKRIELMK